MSIRRRSLLQSCLAALPAGALALQGGAALAQAEAWPAKPVHLIVPFPPGGGTDILSRLIATRLGEATGWTVVADNRAGAGGTIGLGEAARAAPTGYELVMGQKDNMVVAPWLYKKLAYDPVKDFTAVAHVAFTPVVIVTRAESRFKTLKDVVDAARGQPDSVTYGSPGNGTTIHLAGEIFNSTTGIKMRHVPYKGSNPAMMDVLAGNVDLMVSSLPSAIGQLKAGKLRALAVTSAKRSTVMPDIPTVAEQGFGKDFDVTTWYGVFAPAGTPKAVVNRVHTEINKLLARSDVQAAIHEQGAEFQAMSQDAFATLLKTDVRKWKGIVEASGAKIE